MRHPFITAFVAFLLFATHTHAQLPASLQQELNRAKQDTARLRILKTYTANLPEDDSLILVCVDSAFQIIARNHDPALRQVYEGYRADFLNSKGRLLFFYRGDGKEGRKFIEEAAAIARTLDDKTHLSAIYGSLQDMALISGNVEQLKPLLDTSIALQLKVNDKKSLVATYTNLGNYHTSLGQSDSTLYYFNKAYAVAKEVNDAYLEGTLLSAIGFAYVHKGSLQEALPYFYKSVNRMEEAGRGNETYGALQGIGNVFSQMGECEKALAYFDSAIVLAREKPEFYTLSNLYFYKANCYVKLEQPDSAIHNLDQSVAIAEKINFLDIVIAALIKTGSVYLMKGDTTTALGYFRKSLDENKEAQLLENLQESYFYLGLIMLSQHKPDSAFYYAKLSEKLAEKLQFNSAKKQVQFLLSRVYEAKGDYKNALASYKNFIVFRDSVDNERVFRTALEKQFEYDAEKKELLAKAEHEKRDIELKAQKNRLLLSIAAFVIILILGGLVVYINRKRKETLYRQNIAESEMKALRAQMNPHFMFNSLNAIQQMVLNNENENAFKYLDTYSKLTRSILENSEKKWISLQDEIRFLQLYLEIESLRFQHAFTYEIKTGPNVSVHHDKIPAMIVQPLVENAIKHGLLGKEGEKKLLITFDKKEEGQPLVVMVED
ncbi:MAG TPA: tetratricopeptide repeat protein, partial [Chitinophagales bacterium]|nr:tetratricopeptide repeat protein [Chitinophagales bacterium]